MPAGPGYIPKTSVSGAGEEGSGAGEEPEERRKKERKTQQREDKRGGGGETESNCPGGRRAPGPPLGASHPTDPHTSAPRSVPRHGWEQHPGGREGAELIQMEAWGGCHAVEGSRWAGGWGSAWGAASPRLERVLERSMMVCLLGLFSTERLAREMSAVTRVMEILPGERRGWGATAGQPPHVHTHPTAGTATSFHPLPPTPCTGLPGAGATGAQRQPPQGRAGGLPGGPPMDLGVPSWD